jgi:GntR family transcriptional regulator
MNPLVDKTSLVPLYLQLANWIEQTIASGSLKVGDRLQPEGELAGEAGLNRNTVRHAISLLVQKGLLEKQKGVGTFVKRKKPFQAVRALGRMTSFIDDFEIGNIEIEDRIISREKIGAGGEIASRLMVSPGDRVVRIERLRIAEKTPFVLEVQFYPFDRFGRLLEMEISGSMYALLTREFGADLHHSVRTIRAVKPAQDVARKLGIGRTTPCIFLESLAFTAEDVCIEVLNSYYRGDRYLFKVETGQYERGMGRGEAG